MSGAAWTRATATPEPNKSQTQKHILTGSFKSPLISLAVTGGKSPLGTRIKHKLLNVLLRLIDAGVPETLKSQPYVLYYISNNKSWFNIP